MQVWQLLWRVLLHGAEEAEVIVVSPRHFRLLRPGTPLVGRASLGRVFGRSLCDAFG